MPVLRTSTSTEKKIVFNSREGIARNHPFIDGNKRTAFQTADLFLAMNGYDLDAARGVEHADIMEKLAQGLISRDEAAEHFQAYCHKDES
ncbi:type II toxin-antitoxin system death-on-curing family toxin [uncultured Cohaesibacter sp.]|uniref:type II toxin-antitoxin system death-on-curing family toxin n=1 Tax=uncultured Cohaesibacter sp. TaxID=1002546 RepID=UPI0029C68538|nr:type II toxin-antitoxin system death-on-curing family toxin [uncultured Cohaesibacter sp.]